jgi:hypothetical protein
MSWPDECHMACPAAAGKTPRSAAVDYDSRSTPLGRTSPAPTVSDKPSAAGQLHAQLVQSLDKLPNLRSGGVHEHTHWGPHRTLPTKRCTHHACTYVHTTDGPRTQVRKPPALLMHAACRARMDEVTKRMSNVVRAIEEQQVSEASQATKQFTSPLKMPTSDWIDGAVAREVGL